MAQLSIAAHNRSEQNTVIGRPTPKNLQFPAASSQSRTPIAKDGLEALRSNDC